MRKDMSKVLIERPRTQSNARSRKWGLKIKFVEDSDYENIITYTSSSRRRQYGWNAKESTDVLSPLRGYLRSRVGDLWDDVYSDICENMDRRSTVGAHIFTHLWQYVERNTLMVGDAVHYYGYRGTFPVHDWYIHPLTGILCYDEYTRRYQRPDKPVTSIPIESPTVNGLWGKSYQKLEGIWYYTEWRKVERYESYWASAWRYGRNPWQTKWDVTDLYKQQLNKKELKILGLKNDTGM